ncbi:hypothetical protein [Jiangella sp. DSM 45060]|uniref:hypothetical protein n=1 Tax=Jiangella sp. DSM 45060 TaxID=1798224 RepID=UPI00087B0E9A|nr:hypothetical protein [Jiangella sp. DSM 45060]SDT36071.1 hypothetical protein SAMN04515669_3710 [Jiangella sp. DSM 45060]
MCALLRSGDAATADAVADAVAGRARAGGVLVEPLGRYRAEAGGRGGLVLGYGAIDAADVPAGLDRIAAAFREVTPG